MTVSIAKAQGALKEEEGKLKKLLKSLKKLVSTEFLWMLFALLLAIPLALVTYYFAWNYGFSDADIKEAICKVLNGKPLWLGCYVLNVVGVYFARAVKGAIQPWRFRNARVYVSTRYAHLFF